MHALDAPLDASIAFSVVAASRALATVSGAQRRHRDVRLGPSVRGAR